ncbi:hypothetical protein CgunFtcFv8_007804 [Champsocephalus gunnari]|uniref:Uncharacterized protein n=1 Tax=Champsocephalus gunnari TaxID=52237 RepID=A0AAN8CI94_CHAGU|nr:hypothetical protein CgunFtcFv8_007804 [Champsocephalus gunnari]
MLCKPRGHRGTGDSVAGAVRTDSVLSSQPQLLRSASPQQVTRRARLCAVLSASAAAVCLPSAGNKKSQAVCCPLSLSCCGLPPLSR